VKPQDVLSPRGSWQLIDVIWDGTKKGTYWSMAIGRWKDDDGSWRPVLASRWDGPGDSKGMPISTGHAVWFVMPDEQVEENLASPNWVKRFISEEKLPLVRALLCKDQQRPSVA